MQIFKTIPTHTQVPKKQQNICVCESYISTITNLEGNYTFWHSDRLGMFTINGDDVESQGFFPNPVRNVEVGDILSFR